MAELRDGFEFGEDEPVFETPAHLCGGENVEAADDFIVHHAAEFVDGDIHHHFAATAADGGGIFDGRFGGEPGGNVRRIVDAHGIHRRQTHAEQRHGRQNAAGKR